MKQYSINIEISKLDSIQSKVYHYLYTNSGFELGFGRAGKYSGHSHFYFCDVLFSAKAISTSDANGKAISGNLIVIPPRTYLGEVETEDYFFIKFCPTNQEVRLPDKTAEILTDGIIETYNENFIKEIPWFKRNTCKKLSVTFNLKDKKLQIRIGETEFIIKK